MDMNIVENLLANHASEYDVDRANPQKLGDFINQISSNLLKIADGDFSLDKPDFYGKVLSATVESADQKTTVYIDLSETYTPEFICEDQKSAEAIANRFKTSISETVVYVGSIEATPSHKKITMFTMIHDLFTNSIHKRTATNERWNIWRIYGADGVDHYQVCGTEAIVSADHPHGYDISNNRIDQILNIVNSGRVVGVYVEENTGFEWSKHLREISLHRCEDGMEIPIAQA